MRPNATPGDIGRALDGLAYPVSADEVLRHARDQGGVDREVAQVLERIPARSYRDEHDLREAIRAVYLLEGVPPDAVPI